MTTVTVTSSAALNAALKSAQSGETIYLAPGTYSGIVLKNVSVNGNVTVTSQNASHPAVITDLDIQNSKGFSFSNLQVAAPGPSTTFGIIVDQSSNMNFSNLNVQGSTDTNAATAATSLAASAQGIDVRSSSNVTVTNSQFHGLEVGLQVTDDSNLTISGNSFSYIGSDGIHASGSSNVVVSQNTLTNFFPVASDHPDAIQFADGDATTSSQNIIISGNLIARGSGAAVQGIFVKDEVGNLPFENVNIANNTVVGALGNGINVTNGLGVTIAGNQVLSYSDVVSRIVLVGVTGATVSNNQTQNLNLTTSANVAQVANTVTSVVTADLVTASVSTKLANTAHTLVLTGASALTGTANNLGDTIIGNNAGDHIIGGTGVDTLIGGTGNDTFQPGSGNTTMTGGAGANGFIFGASAGQDVITDFDSGTHDTIDISAILRAGSHATLHTVGANVEITFDHNPATITLLGVHASELVATATGFSHT